MSDDDSQKTSSNELNVVGQSSASGGATTEDRSGQAPICVSTRVQNVLIRSTGLPALLENSGGMNQVGLQQATTLSDMGRPVGTDNSPPACLTSSVMLPSASRSYFTLNSLYSSFHCQVVDDDDNNHNNNNNLFSESAFAVLIGGRDVGNDNFTRACTNDVAAIREIFSKMIPKKNIFTITSHTNSTEQAIEYLYLHIKRNKPNKLFLYFSGHNPAVATNWP